MTPEFFLSVPFNGALRLLPPEMDSAAARAMIMAICLQESKLQLRKQVNGPAKGYAQFEKSGGVAEVFANAASMTHAKMVCAGLDVSPTVTAVYTALEHNDILAAAFARLLLWTLPQALPTKEDPEEGWRQYVHAWRPGKPHRETWDNYYAQAWQLAEESVRQEQLCSDALLVRTAAITLLQGFNQLKATLENTLVSEQ